MTGKVLLIGAGPGDPELMTLKAVRLLASADVVLVDALVDRRTLVHARCDARVIDVGKRGGCRSTPQRFIERLMIRHARAGRIVARLKGGDPFVFGRGGEEVLALAAAGVDVEVVNGITAGIAAPAAAGIPLTHRGLVSGVTFVTGHVATGDEPDWRVLARTRTTLVVYMALDALPRIARTLIDSGLASYTPAAVIERATWPTARNLRGTLLDLTRAETVETLSGPAIVVIGAVAGCALGSAGADIETATLQTYASAARAAA